MLVRCLSSFLGISILTVTFLSAEPNNNYQSTVSYQETSSPNNQNNNNQQNPNSQPNQNTSTPKKNFRKPLDREEIALRDRNNTLYDRNLNRGDWDYKENWRYDKEAFYSGEPQSEAYDRQHPQLRGIGYDAIDVGGYSRRGYPGYYYYNDGGYYPSDSYYGNTGNYYYNPNSSYNVTGEFRPVPNSQGYYNTYPAVERIKVPSNPSNNANFDRNVRWGR